MALCLIGAGLSVHLAVASFTLGWTHTIERVPWEEEWRVEPRALVLTQSRVKGSGAGMEPPPQARLVDGWYVWAPDNSRRAEIVLRRARGIADWRFCAMETGCTTVGALLGVNADPVKLAPCS